MVEIHGSCDPRFAEVAAAFEEHFAQGLELGASVAVTWRGEVVVDLWGGDADRAGRPWQRDTIVNAWSVTKTMAALCVLMLADRDVIDLVAPIGRYWPEFAAHGKHDITVAQAMGHTAGVPGWDPPITTDALYDWEQATTALAAQAPWWEPGAACGYHALTQGYLLGEIVRRVTGRTLGAVFRDEVAVPLGADFHIGLPASAADRVAEVVPSADPAVPAGAEPSSVVGRLLAGPTLTGAEANDPRWQAAEIPAAGGIGNARAVARVHGALANGGVIDGVRLLTPEGVERIFVERGQDLDRVLGTEMRWGTGFALVSDALPLSPNPRTCFWGGWGGALAVVDLDARLSIAYVMNRMAGGIVGDVRGLGLVFATYDAIADG